MARNFEIRFRHFRGLTGGGDEECEADAVVSLDRDGSLNKAPDTCPVCGDHLAEATVDKIVDQARADQQDLRHIQSERDVTMHCPYHLGVSLPCGFCAAEDRLNAPRGTGRDYERFDRSTF